MIYPALILFLMACNNTAENKSETEDTIQSEEEEATSERPEIQQIQISFLQMFSFYEANDSSFSASNFEAAQLDTMNLLPAHPVNEKDLKPFYPYFIYNSDSTKAIDLYSYNIMLKESGGKTIGEPGGPDTEIAIVDFRNKTRQRIFFSGPSFPVYDGAWLSNDVVVLAGGETIADGTMKPMILKINLSSKARQYFNYPDTLNITASDYKDPRIEIR